MLHSLHTTVQNFFLHLLLSFAPLVLLNSPTFPDPLEFSLIPLTVETM